MFSCPICNYNHSDGVRCSKCAVSYCFPCADITESHYRKLGPARKAAFQCASCKMNPSQVTGTSPGGTSPASTATLDLVLQELRSAIYGINVRHEQLPSIVQDIKNMKQNLQNLEATMSGIKQDVARNTLRLTEVENKINVLENRLHSDYLQLQAEVTKLSNEININDQMLRLNNIEIKGIPQIKNENLFEVVSKIGNLIGQQINKSDINFVTRAISKTKPKPIIVGFVLRYKKQDFVASAKSHTPGLTAENLGFTNATSRIFINDHLSKANKQLFTKAKKIAMEQNFKYVWVQNSQILTRKNDISPILNIKSESDLINIT